MIVVDKNYFLNYSGWNLDIQLEGRDDDVNKSERQLQRWTRTVYREVNRMSLRPIPKKEELSPLQLRTLQDAVCEYGMFVLENGDLFDQSGYDRKTKSITNQNELARAKFPKHIVDMLNNAGLIKKSLGSRIYKIPLYKEWDL